MVIPSPPPKNHILTLLVKTRKKSAVKHFAEKPILLYFVNLSTAVCLQPFVQNCGLKAKNRLSKAMKKRLKSQVNLIFAGYFS